MGQVIAMVVLAVLVTRATPIDVSLIQLLASPDRFHGQVVRVSGYLHVKFEDSALYLTKEHADHLIVRNAIWVSYGDDVRKDRFDDLDEEVERTLEDFDGEYVLLEGTFDKTETGHMGDYPAGLRNVTRVSGLRRWYD